jgi:hypothetical protein
MRALIALYLAIGVVLLALGFLATGPCETPNKNALNDTVFVLTWPVSLYGYVITGNMGPTQWLHTQACGGGLSGPKVQAPGPSPGGPPGTHSGDPCLSPCHPERRRAPPSMDAPPRAPAQWASRRRARIAPPTALGSLHPGGTPP